MVCLVAIGLIGAGCAHERVPMPPDDATPEQVLDAFLTAAEAGDADTGEALAGDDWDHLEGWFTRGDGLTGHEVQGFPGEVAPDDLETLVWFESSSGGTHQRWCATLDRVTPGDPWRVAELESLAG